MTQRWERQPKETDKAFAAFCAYRDLGSERSLLKAYQQKYSSETATIPGHFTNWSTQYEWVERVKAYDDYLDTQRRAAIEQEQIKAQAEVITNELSDYRTMHQAIQKRLDLLVSTDFVATVTEMSDLIGLIKSVDTYGRRAVGLAEKITSTDVTSGGEKLPSWAEWVQANLNADTETDVD